MGFIYAHTTSGASGFTTGTDMVLIFSISGHYVLHAYMEFKSKLSYSRNQAVSL